MSQSILLLLIALLGGLTLLFGFLAFQSRFKKPPKEEFPLEEGRKIREARTRAKEIILEAKDQAFSIKKKAEEEAAGVKGEVFEAERRIERKEENLDRRSSELEGQKKRLAANQRGVEKKLQEIEEIKHDQLSRLEKIAQLSKEEAKKHIFEGMEKNLKEEIVRRIKEAEDEIRETADKKAKDILGTVIQRAATDYVAEYTTSTVGIPDEDMKGRIIGREGRNIKAFEQATGVDVLIDETPDTITISSFDGVRREIARVAMERLIADGRIQPARIEEIVTRVKKEIEKVIREAGEQLAYDAGVLGLPQEIIDLLGKYKYRYSYGQNLIAHTLEVVNIGKLLAAEIGANKEVVKKACLLHDIGKVLAADTEGSHVDVGIEVLKRQRISEEVIKAIVSHHQDVPFTSLESVIVYVADAISGARPGARRESYEAYLKRIKELENLATSFGGVEKVYAVSAGREVRVIVIPEKVDDVSVAKLAHDIAKKIHSDLTYPGQIKVTVIKEKRATDVAK